MPREDIDRRIVSQLRVGKHKVRFLAAANADISPPLLLLLLSCIFMYITLCTWRASVGKHGVYVWVMVTEWRWYGAAW